MREAVLSAEFTHEEFVGVEGSGGTVHGRHVEYLAKFCNEGHCNIALVGHHSVDVVGLAVGDDSLAVEDVRLEEPVGMAECRGVGCGVHDVGVMSHFADFIH